MKKVELEARVKLLEDFIRESFYYHEYENEVSYRFVEDTLFDEEWLIDLMKGES
jgi:SHS2 domain-containing protein